MHIQIHVIFLYINNTVDVAKHFYTKLVEVTHQDLIEKKNKKN